MCIVGDPRDLEPTPSPSPPPSPSSSLTLIGLNSCYNTPPPPEQKFSRMSARHEKIAKLAPMPEGSEKIVLEAKIERNRQARIYSRTHSMMSTRTKRMFAFASRDYQRQQHLPTKRTRPALLKRRYSIDVSTDIEERRVKRLRQSSSWDTQLRIPPASQMDLDQTETNGASSQTCNGEFDETKVNAQQAQQSSIDKKSNSQALEIVTPFTLSLPFPEPHRYHDFNKYYEKYNTPHAETDTYLEYDRCKITNKEYFDITETHKEECFMVDNHLDLAFALLTADKSCTASSIGILSVGSAQVIYRFGTSGAEEYVKMLTDKRWVFVPVNDGFGADSNEYRQGSHWTLLALDRLHKRAHYFDSYFLGREEYMIMAEQVATRVLILLDEDASQWTFDVEWNSPHQVAYNNCTDFGACGPFVYSMVDVLVRHIQWYQQAGQEENCSLKMDQHATRRFASWWSSAFTRWKLQQRIQEERKKQDVSRWVAEHDAAALSGSAVELVDEPALRFSVPECKTSQTSSRKRSSSVAVSDSGSSMLTSEPSGTVHDDAYEDSSLDRAASPEMGMRTLPSGNEEFEVVDVDVGVEDLVSVSSDDSGRTEEIVLED